MAENRLPVRAFIFLFIAAMLIALGMIMRAPVWAIMLGIVFAALLVYARL